MTIIQKQDIGESFTVNRRQVAPGAKSAVDDCLVLHSYPTTGNLKRCTMMLVSITSGQSNLTTGRIAAANGRYNGIRQITVCG